MAGIYALVLLTLSLPSTEAGLEANAAMRSNAVALDDEGRTFVATVLTSILAKDELERANERARARWLLRKLARSWPEGSPRHDLFRGIADRSRAEDAARFGWSS